MLNTEKGILLIATGHPYYGRMAYNLACTIKASEEDMPVCVVYGGAALSHLGSHQVNIFDELIKVPAHVGGGFSPKLYLSDISPYDKTIFVDADTLWLQNGKTPSMLFDEMGEVSFSAITEGWADLDTMDLSHVNPAYYFWADLVEIKESYRLTGRIYQWRSEFVFFRRCPLIERFFKTAQQIHQGQNLKSTRRFGTLVPDELAINISASLLDLHPHKSNWTPAYWHKMHDDLVPHTGALTNWYLASFGGKYVSGEAKRLHDQTVRIAMKKLGRQHVFGIASKNEFLPERQKI